MMTQILTIVGIVVAFVLVLFAILIGILVFIEKRKAKKHENQPPLHVETGEMQQKAQIEMPKPHIEVSPLSPASTPLPQQTSTPTPSATTPTIPLAPTHSTTASAPTTPSQPSFPQQTPQQTSAEQPQSAPFVSRRRTQLRIEFQEPTPQKPAAILRVLTSSNMPQHDIPLNQSPFWIGALSNNNLVLDYDSFVSGHHCCIQFYEGTLFLHDNNSKNGTYINNERVDPTIPRPVVFHDKIRVGNTEIVLLPVNT